MSFLDTTLLALFEKFCPPDVEECVGNNDQQLLGRHNVSQSDTSKYRGVTRDVGIFAGKDSRKINTSRKDTFIKSNESS